ncbi:MAG: ABC transporter permease [Actinomycetota bacterium]|nr:ABC transporter permease [Actinomycetota bacterium]
MEKLSKYSKYIKPVIFLILVVLMWQAALKLGHYKEYLYPSPGSVLKSLSEGFADGTFARGIAMSLKRILIGFGFSIVVGTLLGFLIGRVKLLEETVGFLVLGLQALPSICWLPIAILWFGLSERAVIFVVIMGALLSITIATTDGVKNIAPVYLRAAKTMGAKGWRLYLDVLAPAALPAIISGSKLGWSFAWRSLMAGELLFITGGGLGFLLQSGREMNDMSRVMAVMAVIIIIGLVVDRAVFAPLETKIRRRWGLA